MYVCAGRRRVCDGAGAVAVLHEHVSVALNELEQQLEQEQKLHLRMLPTDCDLTKEIEVWRSSGDRGMRRRPHAFHAWCCEAEHRRKPACRRQAAARDKRVGEVIGGRVSQLARLGQSQGHGRGAVAR